MTRKFVGSGYGGSNRYRRRGDSQEIRARMSENDWFFNKWNQTKEHTKSNNVYDLVSSGYSVLWSALDEQGRYEVWSVHVEAGGEPMNYPEFCDLMDRTEKF